MMITQKHAVAAATRSRRAGSRTCTRRRRRRAAGTRPAATRAPRAPRSSRARRGSRRARTYMRSVSSPPPRYHVLSRHPALRRWRRETNAQSGRVDGVEAEAGKHTQSTPSTRSFKDAGPARARIETRAHGGARHVQRADVPSIMRRRLERVEPAVPSCLGEPPDACVRRALRHPSPFTPSTRRAVTLNNAEAFFPTPGPRRGTPRRDSRGPTRRIDRTSRRPRRRAATAPRSPPRRLDPRRAARLEAPRC